MIVEPFSDSNRAEWDECCRASPDAWMWHCADWIRYSEALLGNDLCLNGSFLLREGKRVVGVMPCLVESTKDGSRVLRLARARSPWPALLSTEKNVRDAALDAIFDRLGVIAQENGVTRIELFNPAQSESLCDARYPAPCWPNRYGYESQVRDTQVMDLSLNLREIWKDVRKGHRSSIKSGEKIFSVRTWRGAITDEEFGRYQSVHAAAAGRVTRAQATFDLMRAWVRDGRALLVGAEQDGRWVGFSYFLVYKKGAFYASACKTPDLTSSAPVGHTLMWSAVPALQDAGVRILELGLQAYQSDPAAGIDEKFVNICRFKRGFGGRPFPRYESTLTLVPR